MRNGCKFLIVILCVCLVGAARGVEPKQQVRYYALFESGQKIGHAKQTRKVEGTKVISSMTIQMSTARGGTPMTVKVSETNIETPDGKLLGFSFEQDIGIMLGTKKGSVDKNGKLNVVIDQAGVTQRQVLDYPKGALMEEGQRLLRMRKGLKEGTVYSFTMFDLSFLAGLGVRARVGPTKQVDLLGRVVVLTEITNDIQTPMGPITQTNYVDKNFEVLKLIQPGMGIVLELVACSKEFALSEDDEVDFLKKLVVNSPVSLNGAAKAKSITYDLVPFGETKVRIPDTDNQKVRTNPDGSVSVTVRPLAGKKQQQFPYPGKDKTALKALKPSQYLQSDSKQIVSLAKRAVGKTTDAAQAARRIEKFVHEYIRTKDLSVGYASALEVAQSKQGDCTEHAMLTAAMHRAVGIPARVVVGIAYVGKFGTRKHVFVPHAWTEVYVGGKWIGVDAALNGCDARRITLAFGDGNPTDFFGMLTTLGYFKIQKISIEK